MCIHCTEYSFYVSKTPYRNLIKIVLVAELCQNCFSARLENEQKEKLSYARAKLNIRLVPSVTAPSSEHVEYLDSEVS